MSRPRPDPASAVAGEWVRGRPEGDAPATALVIGDGQPDLARELLDAGVGVTRWNRRFLPGQQCSPWPPPGPFDEAWVRMPRAAPEAAMLLHAAAARVPDGGGVHLYGAGREGIRSASRHFPPGIGRVRTALIKRRCRVLAAERAAPPPRVDDLASWQVRAPIDWGAGPRDWTFYPGVFACGRLDPGTALLIEQLPGVVGEIGARRRAEGGAARREGAQARAAGRGGGEASGRAGRGRKGHGGAGSGLRVLDFGAGAGAIGAAAMELCATDCRPSSLGGTFPTANVKAVRRQGTVGDASAGVVGREAMAVHKTRHATGHQVTLLEHDAIALAAAARNVPGATLVLGTQVRHAGGPFDLVVSNPPIHAGGAQTLAPVEALARGARQALTPEGRLVVVAQRRLPVGRLLETTFRSARALADRGAFRVWAAG